MEQLYLSERNLLTLLSKLQRKKNGEETACSIVKYSNENDPFVSTIDSVVITAVTDEEYYTKREPGEVFDKDLPSQKGRGK